MATALRLCSDCLLGAQTAFEGPAPAVRRPCSSLAAALRRPSVGGLATAPFRGRPCESGFATDTKPTTTNLRDDDNNLDDDDNDPEDAYGDLHGDADGLYDDDGGMNDDDCDLHVDDDDLRDNGDLHDDDADPKD